MTSPDLDPQPPARASVAREAWMAAIGILVVLAAVKHLAQALPSWEGALFTAAAAFQLYFPLLRMGKNGVDRRSLGLHLDGLPGELRAFLLAAVLTGIPYGIGFHIWQSASFGRELSWAFPNGFLEAIFVELAAVALAEELFFRGYLQERLETLFPARRRWLGAPFGRAIIWTSAVFAAAHFVGDYRVARLSTFFPSLLFGLLRARRGSLVAPIAYHAYCNLLVDVLQASHQG